MPSFSFPLMGPELVPKRTHCGSDLVPDISLSKPFKTFVSHMLISPNVEFVLIINDKVLTVIVA